MSAIKWSDAKIQRALAEAGSVLGAWKILKGLGSEARKVPGSFALRCYRLQRPAPAAPVEEPTPREPEAIIRERRAARETQRAKDERARALDRVEALTATIERFEHFAATPIQPVEMPLLGKGLRQAAAIALLSDVHCEERVVRSDTIPNEYTLAIAEESLARYFRGVEWLVRNVASGFQVSTILLWLGGDAISGDIHEENLETAQLTPAEAMLWYRDRVVAGIEVLAAIPGVNRLLVPCSYGNHSRTTQRVRPSTGFGHSLEWIMYCDLARHFAAAKRPKGTATIEVFAPRSEHQVVEVFERRLAFHHGHQVHYNGGIGGITIPMIKKVNAWDKWSDADLYHFGHFHQARDLGRILVNGSVIGPNAYSQSIGAEPEEPAQLFYLLDQERGKTGVSPVWVRKAGT